MKQKVNQIKKHSITIGWLYPDLMSTYGDQGNIFALILRSKLRNLDINIIRIAQDTSSRDIQAIDLLFGGGAQDRAQEIVMKDLKKEKGKEIIAIIEDGTPALFVCGAPQLMGKSYEPAVGETIEGLGIFNMVTKNPGPDAPRLIGNIVAEINWEHLDPSLSYLPPALRTIVGFENHGGRTYLGKTAKPFAKVIKGHGNNDEDGTEGVIYKNAVGCYFHGPLLPKNPIIADMLIRKALEKKYRTEITLEPLDDTLEHQAQQAIAKKLGVTI